MTAIDVVLVHGDTHLSCLRWRVCRCFHCVSQEDRRSKGNDDTSIAPGFRGTLEVLWPSYLVRQRSLPGHPSVAQFSWVPAGMPAFSRVYCRGRQQWCLWRPENSKHSLFHRQSLFGFRQENLNQWNVQQFRWPVRRLKLVPFQSGAGPQDLRQRTQLGFRWLFWGPHCGFLNSPFFLDLLEDMAQN